MGKTSFDVIQANSYIGLPMVTSGQVFFLNNSSVVAPGGIGGSDSNSGTSPQQPFSTFAGANAACTANRGDVVYILPGHAETVSTTSMAATKAGVSFIGLGKGTLRPTFSLNATGSTVTVSANNVSFSNLRFIAITTANITSAFTLTTAKNCVIDSCEFLDTSAVLNFLCCVTSSATDNDNDYLTFTNNYVYSLPTTDGAVVSMLSNCYGLTISDNFVDKAATADAGHLLTMAAEVMTGIRVQRNVLTMKALSSQATGTLLTGSATTGSGIVSHNIVYQIDTSTGLLATAGTKFGFIENYMSGAADKSGTIFPAADDPA